jgi:hypothetical protein
MKANYHHKFLAGLIVIACLVAGKSYAQDSAASPTVLGIRYFLPENKVPYIEVSTKKKVGRKFEPVTGLPVSVFITDTAAANLLGSTKTASNGTGRIALPPSFKAAWDSLSEFTFVASMPATGKEEAQTAEIIIKKAILVIDTVSEDGVRSVTAQLKEKVGNEWVAVKDIEMKLGIKRGLGNLSVGEEETYTADTTGIAIAEFKHDSMPGDAKGNIFLVARVEDNDTYGNLVVEKAVPWGKAHQAESHFWHRSLWSTGGRAPVWLLTIALAIIIGVWSTIFYLIKQMFRIRKMGHDYEKDIAV